MRGQSYTLLQLIIQGKKYEEGETWEDEKFSGARTLGRIYIPMMVFNLW